MRKNFFSAIGCALFFITSFGCGPQESTSVLQVLTQEPGFEKPSASPGAPEAATHSCQAADLRLAQFPLRGVNGRDYMINNYVDLDSAPGEILDYMQRHGESARTYDGHTGLDIDVASFREMDSGRAVIYAAAPGVVESIEQQNGDRNTSCTGTWNHVRVRHANGWSITYGHLKRSSARVQVGQSIAAGTVLGVAGSSGCSTHPHLHLEVQDCQAVPQETLRPSGMWASQPEYDPASDVMDVMLRAGAAPTLAQIKDPAPDPTAVTPGALLGVGLSLAARGGDRITLLLTRPDGTSTNMSWSVPGTARFGHWFPAWSIGVGQATGTGTLTIRVNDQLRATRSINVSTAQPGSAEVVRNGVPAAAYQSMVTDIAAAGYRPIWVDGYEVSGATYFNAVFRPADVPWAARHNLTAGDFQTEFGSLTSRGYRPIQIESYLSAGQPRYAAVFEMSPGPAWTAYHGLDAASHQQRFNQNLASGYRPVNISAVVVDGKLSLSALYDRATVGSVYSWTGLTEAEYQAESNRQIAAGRRLAYINAFIWNGAPRISAIWDQRSSGAWEARHALSASEYPMEWSKWTQLGYITRAVTGYEDGGGNPRFAALWTTR